MPSMDHAVMSEREQHGLVEAGCAKHYTLELPPSPPPLRRPLFERALAARAAGDDEALIAEPPRGFKLDFAGVKLDVACALATARAARTALSGRLAAPPRAPEHPPRVASSQASRVCGRSHPPALRACPLSPPGARPRVRARVCAHTPPHPLGAHRSMREADAASARAARYA